MKLSFKKWVLVIFSTFGCKRVNWDEMDGYRPNQPANRNCCKISRISWALAQTSCYIFQEFSLTTSNSWLFQFSTWVVTRSIPQQLAAEVVPANVHYTRNDCREMSALVLWLCPHLAHEILSNLPTHEITHTRTFGLHSHRHEYESGTVRVPLVYFNGSTATVHIHTSTDYLRISLVRAVSVQVTFLSNPCEVNYP